MKVLIPGHRYELPGYEGPQGTQELKFIHKELLQSVPDKLVTIQDGTTNEEVLEVLIDRMQYLQSKFPCRENAIAITNLEQALMWLEKQKINFLKSAYDAEGRTKEHKEMER